MGMGSVSRLHVSTPAMLALASIALLPATGWGGVRL